MDTHLERSESTAHFSAAVPLCNFQVSPPAPEDLQFALQLLQVVSIPRGQRTSILALTRRPKDIPNASMIDIMRTFETTLLEVLMRTCKNMILINIYSQVNEYVD